MMAAAMCGSELVAKGGTATLKTEITKDSKIVDGYAIAGGETREWTTGIFTAKIMSIIAVKLYAWFVKKNIVEKMPDTVPAGVLRRFTALSRTAAIALTEIVKNGILMIANTDIYKIVAIPFGFVTNLTSTWQWLLVVYFKMHALWIVGSYGATIVTSALTPIVLQNMQLKEKGANSRFAGEANNCFETIGGLGAT